MKYILTISILILGCFGCLTEDSKIVSEEIGKSPYEFMFMQRAYPTGVIKANASTDALNWKNSLTKRTESSLDEWEFVGPSNVGGRVTDIEIPVDDWGTYYVGAASGGIFKTENAGGTWVPIFDNSGSLSIGDIEISKTNTANIWVGTGEINAGGGSLAYDGDGVYNSTDGGVTWENKGLKHTGSISKILIDPNDENVLFASAMGPIFKNSSNRGVYKSTDRGDTWNQVLFISDSTGIIDMAIHPTDGNIIYASAWQRVRRPQYRSYGGETSGLYRSTDGGSTWSELLNGLPTEARDKGRISISISQSNPEVLYSRYANTSGSIQGVYRTNNGGDNWLAVNSSQLRNVGFHWWFSGIHVDPFDENVIYNTDFIVQKSVNGGNSWVTAFPNVHVDQHAIAFNTQVRDEVLIGNDGGVYKSENNGLSSTKYENLPITQFYRIFVDPQNSNIVYGGAQDNGTNRTFGGQDSWSEINGGDGFQPLVKSNNSRHIFALSQYGNLVKSTNNGSSFFYARGGIGAADRTNWDTPVVLDPQDSETMYFGSQRVWKSTNSSQSWTLISPDLTNGPRGLNLTFGTITTIDVSPLNSDVLIVGTDDSNVWVSQDQGANWNNVSSDLPNLWTTKVLADRNDVNTVYCTFSGYRYGSDLGHVFMSTDAGNSWTDIGTGLPDIPVNDIVKDVTGNLYVATDIGVFRSDDNGTSWESLGDNLPSVVVTDLHIHEADNFLFAATYGRSAYKISIPEDPIASNSNELMNLLEIYPNPASEVVTVSLPITSKNVTVKIYDNMGKVVETRAINGGDTKISTSLLSKGNYYLKVIEAGNSTTRKLVVN
ncbi:MAG: T9SS type A sorting domain-containing protein [Saprospiraceae bacterium]